MPRVSIQVVARAELLELAYEVERESGLSFPEDEDFYFDMRSEAKGTPAVLVLPEQAASEKLGKHVAGEGSSLVFEMVGGVLVTVPAYNLAHWPEDLEYEKPTSSEGLKHALCSRDVQEHIWRSVFSNLKSRLKEDGALDALIDYDILCPGEIEEELEALRFEVILAAVSSW